jgi:hypothetical protein
MAAALANGLANATGARRHDLPLLGRTFPA